MLLGHVLGADAANAEELVEYPTACDEVKGPERHKDIQPEQRPRAAAPRRKLARGGRGAQLSHREN